MVSVARLLRTAATLPLAAGRVGVAAVGTATVAAASTTVGVATEAIGAATRSVASSAAGAASRVSLGRHHRRAWVGGGRAHIEVRAVDQPGREALADRIEQALRAVRGVRWAQVNAVLGRVIVAFEALDGEDGGEDGAEEGPSVADLIGIISDIEESADVDGVPFPAARPEHPADVEPLRRVSVALGADVVALGASTVGQLLRLTPFPSEVATVLTLLDNEPRVRQFLEDRLGSTAVDLGLGLGTAIAQALTQGPAGLVADIVQRANAVAELRALRASWARNEPSLHGRPDDDDVDALPRQPRPTPLAGGPVERYADRAAVVSVGALGASLAATRSFRRAGAIMAAGVPKAARHGREGFAAHLGRELARRDVIVLDRQVLRRLDRMETVVLDAGVLGTGQLTPGTPLPSGEVDDSSAARRVAAMFDADAPGRVHRRGVWRCGPLPALEADGITIPPPAAAAARRLARPPSYVLGLVRRGMVVAVVPLDPVLDPWARPVADAARRSGLEVVVAGGGRSLAAALGASSTIPGGHRLRGAIRGLQADGKGVVLVAGAAGPSMHGALDTADCSIGVRREGHRPPWGADLVIGPGLQQAPFLLTAAGVARQVSSRSTRYAMAGSAVGAVGALAGPAMGSGRRASLPVNVAALASQTHGILTGAALGRRPQPRPMARTAWHAIRGDDVVRSLRSGADGLPADEAARRRVRRPAAQSTAAKMLHAIGGELANPLTPLLAVGATLSAAVGSVSDAGLVAGVTAANTMIGAVQRVRAEVSIERLFAAGTSVVRVRRPAPGGGGHVIDEVAADHLVPGDVIELRAGDVVPADCRILDANRCEADESALTGESLPVRKTTASTPGASLADRAGMLYEGTSLSGGTAVAIVVAVGGDTEVGQTLADAPEPPPSGVEARLRTLTAVTAPATVASGIAITALGVLRGRAPRRAVTSGVGLMVASVPEGLPLLATMAQQAAAHRLAGRGALARNPRTIEALGRVDTLCFDKTGTLTVGEIVLHCVSDGRLDESVDSLGPRSRMVLGAALRASPGADGEGVDALPHATDRAVVAGGVTAGVVPEEGLGGWEPLGELAFDPARGFHAAVGDSPRGARICVKGAPEVVLARCITWHGDGTRDASVPIDRRVRTLLNREVERLAGRGLRVLAVAERPASERREVGEDRVSGLELLGFVGLADSVRPSAAQAVRSLRDAGVHVVMATGDHPRTAAAIGRELGILNGHRVVSGTELEKMSEEELAAAVPDVSVFARVTPRDKVRIVRAYQRGGRVVAMTGDGANDAPAIRLAHTGIALGESGAPAAREAADLVLVDDRMETILDAVVEGRSMWISVRDALGVLVGGNLGEVGFSVVTTAIAGTSPLSARQFLLVNLLTDMLPALAIALRPPRDRTPAALLAEGPDKSLGAALVSQIVLRAGTTAAGAIGAWAIARVTGRGRRASTVALVALVSTQLGQTAMVAHGSPLVLASTALSIGMLAAIIQTPGVSQFFGCTPLGPVGWAIAGGSASAATAAAVVLPSVTPRVASWLAKRVWFPSPAGVGAGELGTARQPA